MQNLKLSMGKLNDHVATPASLLKQIRAEFGEFYDPCPLHCTEDCLLYDDWASLNYVNPPFSNIGEFTIKAVDEMRKGNCTLMLIPFRPTTNYWKKYILPNCDTFLVFTDAIVFEGYERGLPIPLVLVVFGNPKRRKLSKMNWEYTEFRQTTKI